MTAEKVALGQMLFFDKRLSIDNTISCATCHDPATAFADQQSIASGRAGKRGARNAPTILNAMFNELQFWDGRASSLEEQALQPLLNPFEMGMTSYPLIIARLAKVLEYRRQFRKVFKQQGITINTISKALAAFERTQLSGNSAFDRFIAGDQQAMADKQKQGWNLFQGKARCVTCHDFKSQNPFFTDFKFHNTGVASKNKSINELVGRLQQSDSADAKNGGNLSVLAHLEGFSELGRYMVTKQKKDIGAFKTPTLRDVELTSPYMHDGSDKTLLDVVRFYNRGGESNPNLDIEMRPLNLTDEEMSCLVEFMKALTSDDTLRRAQSVKPQTRSKSK